MVDPLGLLWLADREIAVLSLALACARVASQASSLGLPTVAQVLEKEVDKIRGEASVCRGEVIRGSASHPSDEGACDPEEDCCGECAVEYAAPECLEEM